MPALGTLRRAILTPSPSAVRFDVRGFPEKDRASREHLETVGGTFLTGFAFAAEHGDPAGAVPGLETVDRPYRGFAYEGAAMGFAILDAFRLDRESRIERFLAGAGDRHLYMVHIGIGWALARLPRLLWQRILPADPVLHWLLLDGFGFHQAYFHTDLYVHRHHVRHVPWPGTRSRWYVPHALDQGIGRALWFAGGADVRRVAESVGGFPESRHADLWSGAGLAATYAGGAGEAELRDLWRRAGGYRPQLVQGCAAAALARVRAGLVTPHTRLAVEVFCGLTPEEAAAVADGLLPAREDDGDEPVYAEWRRRVAERFVAAGRC
ncbi:MAG: hypothetical protein JWN54_813 [Mycobacterium sp.]|nr:hypothetical protein [Mycobacterium sp.]